jgi:hypothetical protein
MKYVCLLIYLASNFGWNINQMDAKNDFLHGDLFEEFLMEEPPSFVIDSHLVFRLQKYLLGLNQDPKDWYAKINSFFLHLGFKHCESNHSLYVLHTHGNILIIVV